jgi:hypothetical protein
MPTSFDAYSKGLIANKKSVSLINPLFCMPVQKVSQACPAKQLQKCNQSQHMTGTFVVQIPHKFDQTTACQLVYVTEQSKKNVCIDPLELTTMFSM